jgi:hypothetical protein
MTTWDEFEQQTAFRRPSDWQFRPDGPDEIDLMVADARASGGTISRRDVFAAMAVEPPG